MALPRPLVIFGLRGTLLERIHTSRITSSLAATAPQFTFGLHKVWLRPHVQETLATLGDSCDLALWSSTTAKNTNAMVSEVFGSMPKPFKFVWTREHTKSDDFRRLLSSQHDDEFATLKDLSLVQAAFPGVSLERTVLVDDTPSKSRLNAGNFIWLEEYSEKNLVADTKLVALKDFILKEIVPAPDVRRILPKRL